MTDTEHITKQTSKQFLFEVRLNWLSKSDGTLHAPDVTGAISVATPFQFGGEGNQWSPEHLFLSSISSCYMTTFLAFIKKFNVEITNFECTTTGQVELTNGKYKFSGINVYPKIYIDNEDLKDKINLAIEKTQKYCLISNSVNANIIYHNELLIQSDFSGKEAPFNKYSFSLTEAKDLGDNLGIDFSTYYLNEFRKGMEAEMEYGNASVETNVTNNNLQMTAKIACARLRNMPDYYTRLDQMKKEAEAKI